MGDIAMGVCECGYEYKLYDYYGTKTCLYCLTDIVVTNETIKKFGWGYIAENEYGFYVEFLPDYLDMTSEEKIAFAKNGFTGFTGLEQENAIKDYINTDRQSFAEYIVEMI